jgi:hypothetical protein
MKHCFFVILLFYSSFSFSQITVKGTVYDNTGPLEGAAIYLNNSMLGTTTNKNGVFELPVQDGQYELIVSYLGFKKVNYKLNTSNYKNPLIFALIEEENMLDEVIVRKIVYDKTWYNNLAVFKREFLGTTAFSKNCFIKNEKDLYFNYDAKNNIFSADSKKPLVIINKSLGYKINYDMVHFEINKNLVTRLGYSRFENLSGTKRKRKEWQRNRTKAYKGSLLHFIKSIFNNSSKEEGFVINQFKRLPNPKRPSEEQIKAAKNTIRQSIKNGLVFNRINNDKPQNAIDSAHVVLRKSRLSKTVDYLYKSQLNPSEIISIQNGSFFLKYKDNLSVVYTKEKEETAYLNKRGFSFQKRKADHQTSSIISLKKPIAIDNNFLLINPLDIYLEGYWAFEKMGEMLHIGYKLSDNKK